MASEGDHVRAWLARKMTGCSFAALQAKRPDGVLLAPFPAVASVADIDSVFELAGARRLPAIVILPGLRTELQLVEQLLALAKSPRWRVRRVPIPGGLETDDVFVGLEWKTAAPDLWSSPMGLAPFGTMPATRRAPYTCIAAWTGPRMNTFRKGVDKTVHFLDADLSRYGLNADKYKTHRKASVKATTDFLVGDSATNYRNVAFRLSANAATALAAIPT